MANVTIHTLKAALKTQLEAVVALNGVTIHDAETTIADRDRRSIILGDASATYEHHSMGGRMLETVDMTCRIISRAVSADAARASAVAYLEAVAVSLTDDDWTVAGTALDVDLTSWDMEERVWPDQGRECEIEFVLQYRQTNE